MASRLKELVVVEATVILLSRAALSPAASASTCSRGSRVRQGGWQRGAGRLGCEGRFRRGVAPEGAAKQREDAARHQPEGHLAARVPAALAGGSGAHSHLNGFHCSRRRQATTPRQLARGGTSSPRNFEARRRCGSVSESHACKYLLSTIGPIAGLCWVQASACAEHRPASNQPLFIPTFTGTWTGPPKNLLVHRCSTAGCGCFGPVGFRCGLVGRFWSVLVYSDVFRLASARSETASTDDDARAYGAAGCEAMECRDMRSMRERRSGYRPKRAPRPRTPAPA